MEERRKRLWYGEGDDELLTREWRQGAGAGAGARPREEGTGERGPSDSVVPRQWGERERGRERGNSRGGRGGKGTQGGAPHNSRYPNRYPPSSQPPRSANRLVAQMDNVRISHPSEKHHTESVAEREEKGEGEGRLIAKEKEEERKVII